MSLPPRLYITVQTSRPVLGDEWPTAKPRKRRSYMLLQWPAEVCRPRSAAGPWLWREPAQAVCSHGPTAPTRSARCRGLNPSLALWAQ
eukprot:scaffold50586_cov64-Phaeocystis_antarctica.AAC.1